jgi:4-amino-4-deoxy-L-arabinose transferase-like glycosyltransferase
LALFAVVVLLALPMVRRDLPHPGRRVVAHAAAGALVFALVALPWYIDGIVRHGEPFVSTFLTSGTLGIGRFFRPAISTPPPYWLSVFAYVPLLALGLLPWTPAFLAGLHGLPRVLRTSGPGLRVVVAWFAGIFLVLSLSSGDKVFRYLLPAYPPAAILAGRGLEALLSDRHRLRGAAWLALVPAVALMAAGFWFLWSAFPPERGLLVAVVLPCIGMIAGGLMGFGVAALAGRARAAIAITAVATMVGYAVFARGMLVHADAINPWPALVRAAGAYTASSTRVVLYGRVGEAFNFAHFYFDEPVVAVTTVTDLTALWARERILIVVPAERLEELGVLRPAPLLLHRSPARIVLIANWSAP